MKLMNSNQKPSIALNILIASILSYFSHRAIKIISSCLSDHLTSAHPHPLRQSVFDFLIDIKVQLHTSSSHLISLFQVIRRLDALQLLFNYLYYSLMDPIISQKAPIRLLSYPRILLSFPGWFQLFPRKAPTAPRTFPTVP